MTGTTIELTASDGHRLQAYRAAPAGKPRGGLVVLQEIFGANSHIRAVADGFAADGYLAIAPAIFDRVQRGVDLGYSPEDVAAGRALKAHSPQDKALLDVAAAIGAAADGGKVGIVGYCWGGSLAWFAAAKLPGVAAVVSYYGSGLLEEPDLKPACPVLGHYGEKDAGIPVDGVRALAARRPELPIHLYPAGHGFNCDQRAAWDAPSAKLARERTLAFLRANVG